MTTQRYAICVMLILLLSGCISPVTTGSMVASPPIRLSYLTAAPVRTPDGEYMGRVEALFLDAKTGVVQYVVVSLRDDRRGKLMLTGVKQLAPVPWRFFSPNTGGQVLTLGVESVPIIRDAPTFQTVPDPTVPGWDTAVRVYWAAQKTRGVIESQ